MKHGLSLLLCLILCLLPLRALAEPVTDKSVVQAAQQALNDAGYDCGTPDGIAGKKTSAAVAAFQAANGLVETGVIDEALLIALGLREAPQPALRYVEPQEGEEYGYAQLSLLPHGEALQAFYRQVQAEMETFDRSDADVPESLVLFHYEQGETGLDSEQMSVCVISVNLDHPEFFWLGQISQYNGNILEVCVEPECRLGAERRAIGEATFAGAEALLEQIGAALPEDPTARMIADTTYEALIISMEYDLEAPMAHNMAGAFWGRRAVCDGYAEGYKYLLDRQGVPCIVVTGNAGGEAHAWDCVREEDGHWFLADPTWDDGHFDEANRTYFAIPDRVFNMFHTARTPNDSDYLYPLPLDEVILPRYVQPEGVYVDEDVSLPALEDGFDPLEEDLGPIFEALAPVCREAVKAGKGAFGVKATQEEADLLFGLLLQGVDDADGHTDFFFDLYMRDAAPELAEVYAGLNGKYDYSDGIASLGFTIYEEGTAPERVLAFADDECLGGFPTLAAAYLAMEGRQAEKLSLTISMTEDYCLPALTPLPDVRTVELLGAYGDSFVFTLNGGTYPVNLTLRDVWLLNIDAMTLDLSGHTLRLEDDARLCQPNYYGDTGKSRQCSLKAGRIECEGQYHFEFYCNVEAGELATTDTYKVSFRGTEVTAAFDTVTLTNSRAAEGEFGHTYLCAGDGPADLATLTIGELVILENQHVIISGGYPMMGRAHIMLGNVRNDGGFSLSFYTSKLYGDLSFELPVYEITGACDSPIQIQAQFNTDQPLEAVNEFFEPGETLIYAPQMHGVDGELSIIVNCEFDLSNPMPIPPT